MTKIPCLILAALAAVSLVTVLSPSARANVYATNLKLNGAYTNAVSPQGASLSISYLLNEPATRGVVINILSGANAVRSLAVPAGSPGTLRGTNSVLWDGLDFNSNRVPAGSYSVTVTAAAAGFTDWTQTSVDTNAGNYVYYPKGLAVDQNPSSIYYGRVFVANAEQNSQGGTNVGDFVGILKLNADGSPAEESPSNWLATGGYSWSGGGVSPWKVGVSADDHVYIMDESYGPEDVPGLVYAWDPTLATNTQIAVLRPDNLGDGGLMDPNGLALLGSGTNSQLWIADYNSYQFGGLGIVQYYLTNDVCATNDVGVSVVGLTSSATGSNLDNEAWDLALDKNQNIYVIQQLTQTGSPPVLCFPPYNPATNHGAPELTPKWFVGDTDESLGDAWAVAVDPAGKYVAVGVGGTVLNGLVRVLAAANGATIANLDTDTNVASTHEDTACAWDAVGNLYVAKFYDNPMAPGLAAPGLWLEISPPGTNQATTLAPEFLEVTAGQVTPPDITKISFSNDEVVVTFTAGANESPGAFTLLGAAQADGPYTVIGPVNVTALAPGLFQATFASSLAAAFYRVDIAGIVEPRITSLALSGSSATVSFVGARSDYPWAFTLQSASSPQGPFNTVAGVSATQVGLGQFVMTAPANATAQYYRIRR